MVRPGVSGRFLVLLFYLSSGCGVSGCSGCSVFFVTKKNHQVGVPGGCVWFFSFSPFVCCTLHRNQCRMRCLLRQNVSLLLCCLLALCRSIVLRFSSWFAVHLRSCSLVFRCTGSRPCWSGLLGMCFLLFPWLLFWLMVKWFSCGCLWCLIHVFHLCFCYSCSVFSFFDVAVFFQALVSCSL